MPKSPPTHSQQIARKREKLRERQRPSSHERGYNQRWRNLRKVFLAEHPLCTMCTQNGHTKGASVVDHIIPHKGDQDKFWDESNLQALCKRHHDKKTAKERGWGKR